MHPVSFGEHPGRFAQRVCARHVRVCCAEVACGRLEVRGAAGEGALARCVPLQRLVVRAVRVCLGVARLCVAQVTLGDEHLGARRHGVPGGAVRALRSRVGVVRVLLARERRAERAQRARCRLAQALALGGRGGRASGGGSRGGCLRRRFAGARCAAVVVGVVVVVVAVGGAGAAAAAAAAVAVAVVAANAAAAKMLGRLVAGGRVQLVARVGPRR